MMFFDAPVDGLRTCRCADALSDRAVQPHPAGSVGRDVQRSEAQGGYTRRLLDRPDDLSLHRCGGWRTLSAKSISSPLLMGFSSFRRIQCGG